MLESSQEAEAKQQEITKLTSTLASVKVSTQRQVEELQVRKGSLQVKQDRIVIHNMPSCLKCKYGRSRIRSIASPSPPVHRICEPGRRGSDDGVDATPVHAQGEDVVGGLPEGHPLGRPLVAVGHPWVAPGADHLQLVSVDDPEAALALLAGRHHHHLQEDQEGEVAVTSIT